MKMAPQKDVSAPAGCGERSELALAIRPVAACLRRPHRGSRGEPGRVLGVAADDRAVGDVGWRLERVVIEVEQADVVVFACINGVLFELSRACLGK